MKVEYLITQTTSKSIKHLQNWWSTNIKYFLPEEFDDPQYPMSGLLMDPNLMINLDKIRGMTRCPIHITSGIDVDGSHGHQPHSYHLLSKGAKAVDMYFFLGKVKDGFGSKQQLKAILGSGLFSGIGMYYDWKSTSLGWHLDVRVQNGYTVWIRHNGKYTYLS